MMLAAVVATLTLSPTILTVEGQRISLSGHPATVIVFVSHDCPIANDSQPDLQKIYTKFKNKGIAFVGQYIDPRLSTETVKKHKADFLFTYDQSIDTKHTLVNYLKAKTTPEAFVLDSKGQIQYRGRINDMYSDLGVRRRSITTHDLDSAIASVLAGKKPRPASTTAYGCLIPDLADFDGQ